MLRYGCPVDTAPGSGWPVVSESGPSAGAAVGADAPGADVDVLLVDDDETWARSTAEVLEHQREGFTVDTATTLSDAAAAFEAGDHDCVVSDYQLQRGTGLDLLADVREEAPDRPFVLITGQGSESVASDAIGRQVTDYIPKRSLGNRDDRLARRIESAVESYRTRRALDRERRNKNAMLDILTATTAETELCQQFCSQLVRQRPYACAWIGSTDNAGRLTPRAVAGRERYLDGALGPERTPPDGEPAQRALDGGDLVAAEVDREAVSADRDAADANADRDAVDADVTAGWERAAADCGFERAVAVPVRHDGVRYGVLAAYVDEAGAFTDRERTTLREYADTVGYALRTAEQKRSLMSERPVSLTVEVVDRDIPLVALAARLPADAALTVQSTVSRDDGTTLYVVEVEGAAAEEVADAEAAAGVTSLDVESGSTPVRSVVEVDAATPEGLLAEHGARFERTVVDGGGATVSVSVPDDGTVATVRESLAAAYDDATVSTIWTGGNDHVDTAGDPLADLTERQREVLRHAFDVGYFERPRGASATDLAEHFGVARATVTQHLRTAERKLLDEVLSRHEE